MSHAISGPVVTVRGLTARYGDREALHDISFDVRSGEIFAILGRSGCGKSTLLRHLVGLARPAAGSVHLLGLNLKLASRADLARVRKRVGVAFQGGALINSMSVLDNIELPLRQHTRLDPTTIRIMCHLKLELMNLSGIDKLMPAQLSGGMLKRASIARAVIMDPDVVFLDEPTAGLDPVNAAEVDALLVKLRDTLNLTIVFVTHAIDTALRSADRILVMADGRTVEIGTSHAIQHASHPEIQGLLGYRREPPTLNADDYLARLTAADE
ncbi:MAG: ABC transporter ATP-binding protein [Gammaproteobacteria bacterium]